MNKLIWILSLMVALSGCKNNRADVIVDVNTDEEDIGYYEKSAPEWTKNANMYEVNIRQYTPEGTFNAFAEHIPRLKEMGVKILWLMPIHPIGEKHRKGSMGSYYSVKDYKAVAPEYGTLEDFRALVEKVHASDMKIMIDWVANHSAWDNVWVEEGHLDWYTPDSNGNMQPPLGTDWWDVADLNYDNDSMRAAMIDALKFWVEEFDIDGYRCDVAEWVPIDFWNDARKELDKVKDVFMLAEAEYPPHHEEAFDMSYGWDLHNRMNEIAQDKQEATHITDYLEGNAQRFPEGSYRLQFTSNHDENSWNGTVYERMGDGAKAFAVLAATLEGMPLIYSGQEAGLNRRLEFFEKDEIDWSELPLEGFYKKLLWLNTENEALWNGSYGDEDVDVLFENDDAYVYYREKNGESVLVLLNLSDDTAAIEFSAEGIEGTYTELFDETTLTLSDGYSAALPAWGYKVYHKNTTN